MHRSHQTFILHILRLVTAIQETDGMATENQLHLSKSQTGKSDIHSTLSNKILDSSHLDRKVAPKADAGQNQEVIEGTRVTLDGTKTRTGEDNGLRYSWEQVSGPKVKIVGRIWQLHLLRRQKSRQTEISSH